MDYPSVTQVIGPWIDWSNVPPDKLEFAKTRGSLIHQIIYSIIEGLWVPEIPDSCKPYIESFLLWMPCVAEFVFVEKTLKDPVRKFKGTPDSLIRFVGDSVYTLPDWKSPYVQSKSWLVQVGTYRKLAQLEYPDLPIERTGALQLSPKGSPAIFRDYTNERGGMEYHFSIFLNLLCGYQFFKEK